jgi:hypothetical protein
MATRTATWIGGALLAAVLAATAYMLRRREAGGDDRFAAGTAAVVEPSARGHSNDPAQAAAPVRAAATPGEALAEPEHAPPEGAVLPDSSAGDPLVDDQTDAARAQAAAIGGQLDDEQRAADASGDAAEAFEARAGEAEREKPS